MHVRCAPFLINVAMDRGLAWFFRLKTDNERYQDKSHPNATSLIRQRCVWRSTVVVNAIGRAARIVANQVVGGCRSRKPSLTAEQADDLHKRLASGGKRAVLARELGISRETPVPVPTCVTTPKNSVTALPWLISWTSVATGKSLPRLQSRSADMTPAARGEQLRCS